MILHGPPFLLQVCLWVLFHFSCLATHHLYCCIHWNSSNVTQYGVIFVFLVVWIWLGFKVCSLSLSTYFLEWQKLFKSYCFSKIVHRWSDYNKGKIGKVGVFCCLCVMQSLSQWDLEWRRMELQLRWSYLKRHNGC
jgi:hypothetical protein